MILYGRKNENSKVFVETIVGCGLFFCDLVVVLHCFLFRTQYGATEQQKITWHPRFYWRCLAAALYEFVSIMLRQIHNQSFWKPSTGIAVKIYRTQEIVDLEAVDGKEDLPEFDKRIFFYLDGAELPMIKLFESGGAYLIIGESGRKFIPVAGEYLYGASPFLLPGEHTMKVLIKTKAGKVLEYEWYFFIK